MKKVIALVFVALTAVSCSQTEKGAATGAAAGAIVGGIVGGNVQGAAIGAAIGGVGGALLGAANEPGRCYYRDRYGREYVDACPAGYR
ncbi:YMGG-like glycine zipper-containing protein [Rhizobium sp. L1K21]|uniref:YMGG-like glycine zipper-containing protein n=1 Tax=Rhizobium sp. L1K21 TaxID=2954933 RepID=UPI0020926E0C|nr:glycine zipper domain-containing protein [Rhizobium sp. L1K21]MCO6184922.1 glycine zipper domain-containing protein [Rhizobium sp. L1K21]